MSHCKRKFSLGELRCWIQYLWLYAAHLANEAGLSCRKFAYCAHCTYCILQKAELDRRHYNNIYIKAVDVYVLFSRCSSYIMILIDSAESLGKCVCVCVLVTYFSTQTVPKLKWMKSTRDCDVLFIPWETLQEW